MTTRTFDDLTRAAPTIGSGRRALLALGAAGAAAALARPAPATAKQSAGKKAKKRCKKQRQACTTTVRTFCTENSMGGTDCLDAFLPCCAACNVDAAVGCGFDALVRS